MSLANTIHALKTAKTDIANAIAAKGGTVNAGDGFADFAADIATIPEGSGGGTPTAVTLKDVNFLDYDGTLVASYTIAEAQALTALPTPPDHSSDDIPLTFQEWNYSLAQVNATTRPMDVGATYITADGKTYLRIRIATEWRMTVPLYFSQTVANGVTIDWGDGTAPQTLSGTGNVSTTHTYASPGDYKIALTVATGCTLGLGRNSSSYSVMGSTGNNGRVYCNMLQEACVGASVTSISDYAFAYCSSLASVTIPDSVTSMGSHAFAYCSSLASVTIPDSVTSISDYAFYNCYSLASITIPDSVTSMGSRAFAYCCSLASVTIPDSVTSISDYAFYYCYSLASITIPDSVTSMGSHAFAYCSSLASVTIPDSVTSISDYAFYYCYSLASITIPDSVTSMGNRAFYYCYSLASITIPDSVTSISDYAFAYCYGMAIYDFSSHTSVPTLENTNAFNNIPSDCIIQVPAALYDTWKTATNWATYASKMVAV